MYIYYIRFIMMQPVCSYPRGECARCLINTRSTDDVEVGEGAFVVRSHGSDTCRGGGSHAYPANQLKWSRR